MRPEVEGHCFIATDQLECPVTACNWATPFAIDFCRNYAVSNATGCATSADCECQGPVAENDARPKEESATPTKPTPITSPRSQR